MPAAALMAGKVAVLLLSLACEAPGVGRLPSISDRGCACRRETVDYAAPDGPHSWYGCCGEAGWCDVEPGCDIARDARGDEYAGWDTCLPTTSGCWGARITLDLVERARQGGARKRAASVYERAAS